MVGVRWEWGSCSSSMTTARCTLRASSRCSPSPLPTRTRDRLGDLRAVRSDSDVWCGCGGRGRRRRWQSRARRRATASSEWTTRCGCDKSWHDEDRISEYCGIRRKTAAVECIKPAVVIASSIALSPPPFGPHQGCGPGCYVAAAQALNTSGHSERIVTVSGGHVLSQTGTKPWGFGGHSWAAPTPPSSSASSGLLPLRVRVAPLPPSLLAPPLNLRTPAAAPPPPTLPPPPPLQHSPTLLLFQVTVNPLPGLSLSFLHAPSLTAPSQNSPELTPVTFLHKSVLPPRSSKTLRWTVSRSQAGFPLNQTVSVTVRVQ
eukprot:280548-Rhodomonas_salina.1